MDALRPRARKIAGIALALHGALGFVTWSVQHGSRAAPAIEIVLGAALLFAAQSWDQTLRWTAVAWAALQMVLAIATSHASAADGALVFVFYGGVGALLRLARTRAATIVVVLALGLQAAATAVICASALPGGTLAGHAHPWRLHLPPTWRKLSWFGPIGDADGAAGRPDIDATVRVTATSIANGNFAIPGDVAEQVAKRGANTFSIAKANGAVKPEIFHVRSDDAECLVSLVAAAPIVYEVRACAPPAAFPGAEGELRGIVASFEVH